jgi:uncharacterized protein (UPF0261 family)
VSALDEQGQPFADPAADAAALAALHAGLDATDVPVHEIDAHVNDEIFALAVSDRLHELIAKGA